jgi:lipoprotein-anchoring transpeptidase ErfK/SrfK
MPQRPADTHRPASRRAAAAAAGLLAIGLLGTACNAQPDHHAAAKRQHHAQDAPAKSAADRPAPVTSAARVVRNVHAKGVHVDKVVKLTAEKGTFRTVTVREGKKHFAGGLSADKTTWTAKQRLEPGTTYTVHAVAVDKRGLKTTKNSTFRTEALTLDEQTYPSFSPVAGDTVGIGMPVIVRFDRPVTDKASIEKHLSVHSTSHQRGAWHWISDNEVHWRPATYWKPGTDVTVSADIDSIPAGNGIYGQLDRSETFHIGRSVVTKVNIATHHLRTYIDGKLARTIPVTTGKPGFTTRSGVKVIVEKFRHKRMDSETIGISHDSANGYDLNDVEYAMRLTYSGEFLHAAPWSVGSQGYANVSHGCTGMSTANAEWLYENSKVGDPVEFTGSDKPMTLTNGFGDWNESFAQYRQGSALS